MLLERFYMSPLSTNEFSKRIATILNRNFKSAGILKKDIAKSLRISDAYLSQLTSKDNKYNKLPMPTSLLWNIIKYIETNKPESHISKDVESVILNYGNKEYLISYHTRKAIALTGSIEKVINKLETLYRDR